MKNQDENWLRQEKYELYRLPKNLSAGELQTGK